MKADVLYSGSRGNAILVRSGGTGILIDCGKSAAALCKAIVGAGYDIRYVSAVFITHEHSDHTSALGVLCKKHSIPIHITERSALRLKERDKIRGLILHESYYEETVGNFTVKSFPVPHDSCENVGYIITDIDGDTLGIATDIGHVNDILIDEMTRCRRVIIESNHDETMLDEGSYPFELKKRIRSPFGHLPNGDCADLAVKLAKCGCEAFALAHISADNNTSEKAYKRTRNRLDEEGFEKCAVALTYQDSTVTVPNGIGEKEYSV